MWNYQKVPNFTQEGQSGIFNEKDPNNNFSTNEPISTNNIPIDSDQQA
jgi:hypothetical protein